MAVLCLVAILSLSDSMVWPVDDVASIVRRTTQRLVSGATTGVGVSPSLPFGTDKIMHFGGWAGVGFLACGLLHQLTDRINLAMMLVTLSAFLETGQRYLTSSRSAEVGDLIANCAGLALGYATYALVERTVTTFLPELWPKTEALLRRRLRFG